MENQVAPAFEILLGLYQLQKETEQKYTLLLRHLPGIEGDISSIFERIVEACRSNLAELKIFLKENYNLFSESADTKPTLEQLHELTNRKNILRYCLNDVEKITNAYSIALSWKGTERTAGSLPLAQMEKITRLHEHLKKFSESL